MEANSKTKTLHDLVLTCSLIVNGNPLIKRPTREPTATGKRLVFTFEDTEKLERDILDFYNRVARVDPLAFSEVFRNLKAIALQGGDHDGQ